MPTISTYYNQLWLIDYSNHLPNFHEWFLENNIEFFFSQHLYQIDHIIFPFISDREMSLITEMTKRIESLWIQTGVFLNMTDCIVYCWQIFLILFKAMLIVIVITKHTGVSELIKLSHLNIFFISSPLIHKQMYTR